MIYKVDEFVDTKTYGILRVVAPITYKQNNHPNYCHLGGKTLYWFKDLENKDVLLWDDELEIDLTDEEKLGRAEPMDDVLIDEETGT